MAIKVCSGVTAIGVFLRPEVLGFGVPYFNTFFLKGTIMKLKFILFSPWLLKSPG